MFLRKYFSGLLLTAFLLGLINTSSFSQSAFEGIIKFSISDEETTEIQYYTKADKIRMEVGGTEAGIMIYDATTIKMLMPSEKMYMEFPMSMVNQMNESSMEDDYEEVKEPVFTGKSKEILGYECKQMMMESEDGEVEIWVTDELGNFFPMQSPMGGGAPMWQNQLSGDGFFPMLVITRTPDGEVENEFKVTEVQKKDLDDDLFTAPKGWQKMNMPGY